MWLRVLLCLLVAAVMVGALPTSPTSERTSGDDTRRTDFNTTEFNTAEVNAVDVSGFSTTSENPNTIDFGLLGGTYTITNESDPKVVEMLRYLADPDPDPENSGGFDLAMDVETTPSYFTTVHHPTESTASMVGRKIVTKIVMWVGGTMFTLFVASMAKVASDKRKAARIRSVQQRSPHPPSNQPPAPLGAGLGDREGTTLADIASGQTSAATVAA